MFRATPSRPAPRLLALPLTRALVPLSDIVPLRRRTAPSEAAVVAAPLVAARAAVAHSVAAVAVVARSVVAVAVVAHSAAVVAVATATVAEVAHSVDIDDVRVDE